MSNTFNMTSEYTKYYTAQAGNGITGFKGYRFQKGHGFFGRMLKSFAKPLLGYLGKRAWDTGMNIVDDTLRGENIKTSGKRRFRETVRAMGSDARRKIFERGGPRLLDQEGSGFPAKSIKRMKMTKRVSVKRKTPKRRKIVKRKTGKRSSFLD